MRLEELATKRRAGAGAERGAKGGRGGNSQGREVERRLGDGLKIERVGELGG